MCCTCSWGALELLHIDAQYVGSIWLFSGVFAGSLLGNLVTCRIGDDPYSPCSTPYCQRLTACHVVAYNGRTVMPCGVHQQ
jgi:hypothetical protein